MLIQNFQPHAWDERRDLVVPGDYPITLTFCVEHFIAAAHEAITDHGNFYVALSGGSTPKAIFEHLSAPANASRIDWSKVHLFWSDERAVPPTDPDSNYHMALSSGLKKLPIPPHQIHRMCAETAIEENALKYEQEIKNTLKGRPFDLMMLGMGEDGHTASLFPETEGLKVMGRQVIANFIPQKKCWRMTLTFECINAAIHKVIYVLGASKKHILAEVLLKTGTQETFPVQRIGTAQHRVLWIADEAAAAELKNRG